MVLGERHTDHGTYVMLAKALVEVGEVLPLIIESGIGVGGDGVVSVLSH